MLLDARSRPLHETALAIAVAIGVELLLLATLNIQHRRQLIPYEDAGGINVQVVGLGKETGEPAARPVSLAERLFEDVQRRNAPIYVALPLDKGRALPKTLSEFFGDAQGKTGEAAPVVSSGVENLAQLAAGRLGDPRAQASVPRQPQFDVNGKAIACWNKPTRLLPVRLIVVLDARGAMVGRPVVDPRSGVQPGSPAEQEALRAMAQCSPYGPPTVAGTYLVVELDFSRQRDWVRQVGTTEIR
jgi:hypothetical protein